MPDIAIDIAGSIRGIAGTNTVQHQAFVLPVVDFIVGKGKVGRSGNLGNVRMVGAIAAVEIVVKLVICDCKWADAQYRKRGAHIVKRAM